MNAPQRFHALPEPSDRVARHLENWRDYMRTGGTKGLGAPTKAAGFVGGGYNNDFDSMCLEADSVAARAMDALILGLTPVQQACIHHKYLSAVYRFPRCDMESEFLVACARLAEAFVAWDDKCIPSTEEDLNDADDPEWAAMHRALARVREMRAR